MKLVNDITTQNGLTLVELMVAMALGLVVTAAVAGLFLQTKSSSLQNDEIGYLQDNGRYALKVLANDLEMSNFWAGMSASERSSIKIQDTNVALDSGNATIIAPLTVAGTGSYGCSQNTENWNYDFDQPLVYLSATTDTNATTTFPCIPNGASDPDIIAKTDVLMIKRTKGEELDVNQVDGAPYIRGNRNISVLHKYKSGSTSSPPAGYFDWQYYVRVYYVVNNPNTGIPELRREALGPNSDTSLDPVFNTEQVAEGIERFHVMFGIDENSDGKVDYFTSSPDNATILNAVQAKVYVLARASKKITGYKNTKSYQLGDLPVAVANDGYYRRVFSTTVIMKNTQAVLEM